MRESIDKMHYYHEKKWIELYEQEINCMLQDINSGNLKPVIDHLETLRSKIVGDRQAQLAEAARRDSVREFPWGVGHKTPLQNVVEAFQPMTKHGDAMAAMRGDLLARGIIAK